MYYKHDARLTWLWVICAAVCAAVFVLLAIFCVDAPGDVRTQEDAGQGLGRETPGVQLQPREQTLENEPFCRVSDGALAQDETDKRGSHAPEPQTLPVEVAPDPVPVADDDAVMLAKTVAVEAPYCPTMEQAAVMWCVLNRCDDLRFPATVAGNVTITSPRQFGYYPWTPLRADLYELALDVLSRWEREKNGEVDVGRVLPREYLYFWGDGVHNHFRVNERDRVYWDWSWGDPYA